MNFRVAVIKCFMLYTVFSGRAKRAEFWWFFLFSAIVGLIGSLTDSTLGTKRVFEDGNSIGLFQSLIQIVIFLPGLAVGSRRLHDTNKTGWWQLLWIIPIFGWIPLIIFLSFPSNDDENKYSILEIEE
ncbi:MAG: DUF805 domain-containing protein [Dehalococcoidales bacterium]|jgi:uncharacterized membrane protein YhaH (DUF805 family)|nr:DUF805 domain-containing protein [Dehalococcoidales bacterium]